MTVSLWRRLRARMRLGSRVAIWYHPTYELESLKRTGRLLQIDINKGERAIDALIAARVVRPADVRSPAPASIESLSAVHPFGYLEAVTQPEALGRIFGLPGSDVDVDSILTSQRMAVGGTIEAARWAVRRGDATAFNLGGGFHHAEPESGAGFCVYNDVAVAIHEIRAKGGDLRVAIVDLDFHQGNGNLVAFSDDPSVLTFSMHGSVWSHSEGVSNEEILLPEGTGDADYLNALAEALPRLLESHRPDLIFYVAGTDVLDGDELGAFRLSNDGVFSRDRFVIEQARRMGCPVVVTLAGGYSSDSWRSIASMVRWVLTDEARSFPRSDEDAVRLGFQRIARSFDERELQAEPGSGESWGLTEEDLLGDLGEGWDKRRRILDYYTVHGVELALERYGLNERLRKKGFSEIQVTIDPSRRDRQRIFIRGRKGEGPLHLLIEAVLRRASVQRPSSMEGNGPIEVLSIEWLLLQDPTRSFSLRQPALPGQEHPGLGMVREVMELFYQACVRLGLSGIMTRPSHYHIAAVAASHFHFLDPAVQGRFDALRTLLTEYDLGEASVALFEGRAQTKDGTPIAWNPSDFVAAVDPGLARWFESESYRKEREAAREVAIQEGARLAPA